MFSNHIIMDLPKPGSDFFTFIASNSSADISALRLKLHGKALSFDLDLALIQIECRRKCSSKLKKFVSNCHTIFPSTVSSEQASHEAVANFHSSLISCNDRILDMTAGLGIDSFAFSSVAKEITSCEIDPVKASFLKYNIEVSGTSNMKAICCDSMEFLSRCDNNFDLIFVDPARRGNGNSRVYNFKDCKPDILSGMNLLLSRAETVMIKASPFLDISQTLRDIPCAKTIRAISVKGECKEILIEASLHHQNKSTANGNILAEAIDLNADGTVKSRFQFFIKRDETNCEISEKSFAAIRYVSAEEISPGKFIYEPNAPVMKLAPWHELCERYPSIKKAAASSHLFFSDIVISDFPGRILEITDIPDKKRLKSLKGEKINVVTRNYPMQASDLKKKLGLLEGDDTFLYASRLSDSSLILVTAKRMR